MWLTWWFLIFGCTTCIVRGFPTSPLNVGIHESQCQRKENILFCDHHGIEKEHVQLKRIQDESLKKVFLYNIRNLSLSDSVCVNIALHDVTDVVLTHDGTSKCDQPIDLIAKKCNLNRIPSNITSLFLEDSKVSVLATSSALSKLEIKGSEVEELELSSSFINGTKALITDSRILALRKLVIGPGSSLEIQKSTLGIAERNGLEINNGSLTMKESSVTTKEGGIILSSGAILTVENLQGQMTVMAKLCIDECSKAPVNQNSVFVALFFITFFLLIMTWTAIAYIILQRKDILKKHSSDEKDSEKQAGSNDACAQNDEEVMGLLVECIDIQKNPISTEKGLADRDVNGAKKAEKNTLPTNINKQHDKEDKQPKICSDDTIDSNPVQERTVDQKEEEKITEIETPVTKDCQPGSGEKTESSKDSNSGQSNELINKKMELKSVIEEEKAKHQKHIENLYKETKKANSSSKEGKQPEFTEIFSEIEVRCEILTSTYNFHNFLQKREIYLLTTLTVSKDSTSKADEEKMREILVACDNFEKEPCLSKDMFLRNMKQFSELLSIITNPGSLESCKTPVRVPDEETKNCIQQLHRNSAFKKKEITKPLGHIALFILQDIRNFGIQIQESYRQELKKRIELMESVCYYVVEELLRS